MSEEIKLLVFLDALERYKLQLSGTYFRVQVYAGLTCRYCKNQNWYLDLSVWPVGTGWPRSAGAWPAGIFLQVNLSQPVDHPHSWCALIWMIIIGKSWLALVRVHLHGVHIVHPVYIIVDTCRKKYIQAVQNLQESHEYYLDLTEVPTHFVELTEGPTRVQVAKWEEEICITESKDLSIQKQWISWNPKFQRVSPTSLI